MMNFDTSQSRLVILILLSSLAVPSIIYSIYIFLKFIQSRQVRLRINNQMILVLLITTFIQVIGELPLTLIFLGTGSAAILSDGFCQFWIIFNYACFTGALWTMAIVSIQRYWLIFHRPFFDRHILLFHYLPIILCLVYPWTTYTSLVLKYPCESFFDYSQWTCGGACYLYEYLPGTLDWIINGCLNVILSTAATWIIIIRVIMQRMHVTNQRTVWQRTRRTVVQLISLSTLYMIVWLPCVFCFVITLFQPVPFLTAFYSAYLSYYQYLSCLLCPFACLLGSSEMRQLLRQNQMTRVRPLVPNIYPK